LFCKFARDDKGLYSSDELAAKMAKNEIRNSNAVLSVRVGGLHMSLMACHSVRGHSIITTAHIPIGRGSLVYGSGAAAEPVADHSPEMKQLVERVAAQLGLLPHQVAGQPEELLMALAVDCEGHICKDDGRL